MDVAVRDEFADKLDEEQRFVDDVLQCYSIYRNSDADARFELLDAATIISAEEGQSLINDGFCEPS
jgi:hypothetical protein